MDSNNTQKKGQPRRGKWETQAQNVFNAESAELLEKMKGDVNSGSGEVKLNGTTPDGDTSGVKDSTSGIVSSEAEKDVAPPKEDAPQVVNNDIEKSHVASSGKEKKPKESKQLVTFDEGKASFNGKFLSEQRTHSDFKQVAVGIPKNIHAKTIGFCAEHELTLSEAMNLLLIDMLEKGNFPKDLMKRYKNQ